MHLATFTALNLLDSWLTLLVVPALPGPNSTLSLVFARSFLWNLTCYVAIVGVVYSLDFSRLYRERAIASAELSARLSQAQLRALQSQLRPHFLFNTLNAVAEQVYTDPAAADRMIMRLGALLRASLSTTDTHEIPLRDELGTLDHYFEIMKLGIATGCASRCGSRPAPSRRSSPPWCCNPSSRTPSSTAWSPRSAPPASRCGRRCVATGSCSPSSTTDSASRRAPPRGDRAAQHPRAAPAALRRPPAPPRLPAHRRRGIVRHRDAVPYALTTPPGVRPPLPHSPQHAPDFRLETWFSRWEFDAPWNLAASDMATLRLDELLALADADGRAAWDALPLGYTPTFGTPALREAIAATYSGIRADDVIAFTGAEEGIWCAVHASMRPGDHAVVVIPCYQSSEEIPRSIGPVTGVPLRWRDGWALDLDELRDALRPGTSLVIVNFPHNPTGHVISEDDFRALVALTEARGITLLSDEVYRGLERAPRSALPQAADLGEHTMSLGVLSKALWPRRPAGGLDRLPRPRGARPHGAHPALPLHLRLRPG